MRRSVITLGLLAAFAWLPCLSAQSAWQPGHAGIGFGQAPSKQWVQMVSSPQVALAAGHPGSQPVRFLIQTGYHINSHTPLSPYLIPTTLTLDAPAGLRIARIDYPQGVEYHFSFSPKEALSVYTNEFTVLIAMNARPGQYKLHGQLRYQACDNRACNPPKTLPVTLDVIAR